MNYENALNFLLYSYFGIDGGVSQLNEEKNHKSIVVLCAHRAYLDLARTVKYKYTSTKLESMSSKKATDADQKEADLFQTAKTEVINKICDTILNAVDGDKIHCCNAEFTDWHRKKCDEIIGQMNEATYETEIPENKLMEKDFTYGQAQKWLNMTLKYLWLLDLLPKDFNSELLHVPIDSYIIEAAKAKKNDFEYGLEIDNKLSENSWSTWDNYDEYLKYQIDIKNEIKDISPLEWEGKAWIEIAKKHS